MVFFDSNVPLYLISDDSAKANAAEELLAVGGVVSVQVLNEFVAIARRKHRMPWPGIRNSLSALRQVCSVVPLTTAVHDRAVQLSIRHDFHIYDANIVASALECGADTLYSEDFSDGRRIDGLVIRNPFATLA